MNPHQINKINVNGLWEDPSRVKLMYGVMPRKTRKNLVYFDSASYERGEPTGKEHRHLTSEVNPPQAPVSSTTHARSRLREQVVPDSSESSSTPGKSTASHEDAGNHDDPAHKLSGHSGAPVQPSGHSGIPIR